MLESLIPTAVLDGRLHAMTLYRTPDGKWQASRSADGHSWSVHIDTDPVRAMKMALLGGNPNWPSYNTARDPLFWRLENALAVLTETVDAFHRPR
jgi:hypothetical protein